MNVTSKSVIYPGSFDPITKGHEDVIKRSLALFDNKLEDQINNLFKIAVKVNLDGIVCSPHELKIANTILGSPSVKITPGIRDIQAKDDQARTMSAKEAIERGSSFLVIGRPITQAEDINKALQNFNDTIYEK